MKKSFKASLIALSIAAIPLTAEAAGLGRLNVFSALGQPLRAEVELSATPAELQSITARVAPQSAFASAGIGYSPVLSSFRFEVVSRGERPVLRITSDRPVSEPFIDLMIELQWASGRLVREYTFLLDPPNLQASRPTPATASPARTTPPPAPATSSASPSVPSVTPRTPRPESYEVRAGDTLHRIAQAHKPDGVSLEQMLVALLRGNPEAFDHNNMNRLRAGRILAIPEAAVAAQIPDAEARREIRTQSQDFEAYRRQLADATTRAPRAEVESAQESAGLITPRVEEPVVAADVQRDEVQVSRTEALETGELVSPETDPLMRIRVLEEDLAARDRSLDEANARLQALEESVRELQQLIAMRSEALAQAQQQAQRPVQETPSPTRAPAPPPPELDAEEGLLDTLLRDPTLLYAGGGVLILLLVALAYRMRKKRGALDDDDLDLHEPSGAMAAAGAGAGSAEDVPVVQQSNGGARVDTGPEVSVLATDFGKGTISAIDAEEGVDPVAEADVYIAYGRDAQAEEILLDAMKADPERAAIALKLLEIYANRNSLKQFEGVASDLYARTSGKGEDWEKASAMGRKLDPENPLYAQAAALAGAGTAAAAVGLAAALPQIVSQAEEPSPDNGLDFPMETGTFELPELANNAASAQSATDAAPADGLDFDLPLDQAVDAKLAQAQPQPAAVSSGDGLDFDLDFSLPDDPAEPAKSAASTAQSSPEIEEFAYDEDATKTQAEALHFDLDDSAEAVEAEEISAREDFAGAEFSLPGDEAASTAGADDDLMAEFSLPEEDFSKGGSSEDESFAETILTPMQTAGEEEKEAGFDSSGLDFDLDLGDEPSAPKAAELDLSEIDLSLDAAGPAVAKAGATAGAAAGASEEMSFDLSFDDDAAESKPFPEVDLSHQEPSAGDSPEAETKLELARAYEDMGDKEGARELLDEVLQEGSAAQQQRARDHLARIA